MTLDTTQGKSFFNRLNKRMRPELYSVVKMVRKCGGRGFDCPGAICHHTGVLFRINGRHNYVDVIYKDKGKARSIRMFMNEDGMYQYHDNDNNTEIYLYKTISKTLSPKCDKFLEVQLGVDYEVEKCIKHNELSELFLCAISDKSNKMFGIFEDDVLTHTQESEHTGILLRMFNRLGGFRSHEFGTLVRLLNSGYDPKLLKSLTQILTSDELNKLNQIVWNKNAAIKDQDYEKAAEMRDEERTFQNQFRTNKYPTPVIKKENGTNED